MIHDSPAVSSVLQPGRSVPMMDDDIPFATAADEEEVASVLRQMPGTVTDFRSGQQDQTRVPAGVQNINPNQSEVERMVSRRGDGAGPSGLREPDRRDIPVVGSGVVRGGTVPPQGRTPANISRGRGTGGRRPGRDAAGRRRRRPASQILRGIRRDEFFSG